LFCPWLAPYFVFTFYSNIYADYKNVKCFPVFYCYLLFIPVFLWMKNQPRTTQKLLFEGKSQLSQDKQSLETTRSAL